MKYEYRCPIHGIIRSDNRGDVIMCSVISPGGQWPDDACTQPAQRVWGFSFKPMFQSHYNPAVGVEVNSPAELQSSLSQASDSMNERGIPSDFRPIDLRDKEACGVTNDGLDATYDRLRAQGKDDQARKLKALMDD